jgi:hypothetical protein
VNGTLSLLLTVSPEPVTAHVMKTSLIAEKLPPNALRDVAGAPLLAFPGALYSPIPYGTGP